MYPSLQKFFDSCSDLLDRASARWGQHANRRTLIVLCVGGSILLLSYLFVIRPPDRFPIGQLVTISDDASLTTAASELKDAGVVRSALALKVLVVLGGGAHAVHAGDYLFKEPKDIFSVARTIVIGAYGLEPTRFRIPEGATVQQMATIFSTGGLLRFDPDAFIAKATPYEGYLFPDTYFFLPNTSEDKVIAAMRQNFDAHIAAIQPQINASGKSLSDLVIMASLLEREARDTRDRQMIAGVLWNRLARGMPLQVDAAFLYTLGKNTFQLTIADLKSDSPYNTYVHKGLPPGPIGSPSLDSILAAATPTPSKYLYYLADRHGVTHYAKTYAQHLQNKARYL